MSVPSTRVLSLTSQFQRNVPGTIMAVRLTARPVFVLYLVARRWLIAGSPR